MHKRVSATAQASVSSQRPSSLGSPALRHVVGMQLLAGGGEDAEADAAQVEGGSPVESFDAFCLAQRAGAAVWHTPPVCRATAVMEQQKQPSPTSADADVSTVVLCHSG